MSTVFPYKGKKTRKVSRNFVSNENYCCSNTPPTGHPAGPLGIRDCRQVQQQRAAAAFVAAANFTGKMPLSQGYCLKPSLASKKRVLKVLRKENQQHMQQQQQQDTLPCHGDSHLQCYLPHGDSKNSLNLSYLLGESFAKVGSLAKAFDVYELIASRQLDGHVPLDKLGILASALTNHIRQMGGIASPPSSPSARTQDMMPPWLHYQQSTSAGTPAGGAAAEGLACAMVPSPALSADFDPLLCPLCGDILRCPVTTNCGHTFCRQCCETITQCNICQVKFPRVQDASTRGGGMPTACALTTTTSSSAGSSFYAGFGAASTNQSQSLSLVSVPMGYGLRMASQMAAAPMTVTTTTVASTTATATTTMASTSAAASAAGIISGYALGGGSSAAMKFMPDVLVRRLVEKWWGPDLQAKEISEKASSCMHLNLLDEALKFCNASLDKDVAVAVKTSSSVRVSCFSSTKTAHSTARASELLFQRNNRIIIKYMK